MNLPVQNGHGGADRRRWLQIGLLALAVVLVGALALRWWLRVSAPTEVWIVNADLPAGTRLRAQDLDSWKVRRREVPPGAVFDRASIEGQELARPKLMGVPIVREDLARPEGAEIALAARIPSGRVLTTLRIDPNAMPYKELRQGDRLDVVAVEAAGDAPPRLLARDAWVMGYLTPPQPVEARRSRALGVDLAPPAALTSRPAGSVSILLAVHPGDAFPLAEAARAATRISVVLHGRLEVETGALLPIGAAPAGTIEVISGARRSRVTVQP